MNRRKHPFRISVFNDSERIELIVYIWNVTRGGDQLDANPDAVVSMCGLKGPVQVEPGHQTVALGWDEDRGVLIGIRPPTEFTVPGEPPTYPVSDVINQAMRVSFGFSPDAATIAFLPHLFVVYLRMVADGLHNSTPKEIHEMQEGCILGVADGLPLDELVEFVKEFPAASCVVRQRLGPGICREE